MDVINTSKVALTRNDHCGNRPRRAATAGTRSAMLLLAAVASLTGVRAARADEAVVAWGNNQYGQCTTPPGIGVVDAIAAGVGFTVALKADGAVVAWGSNADGQCTTPLGIGVVNAVSAGGYFTVALKANGSVVAWGSNAFGQCTTPSGIGVVTAVAAGAYHTVALKADGAVVAWGYNGEGQCNIPAGIGPGTAIAAGFGHTVARANTLSNCEEQLAAAQAVIAQQAAEILLLNARIVILQLGDLNEDGVIDSGDLATLLNSWGTGGK